MRRGGAPQYFRGRGGGPPRFGNPNFDPNWGPPPMYGPPPMGFGNPQMELWVETKTEDGKSYYYHALTRETTWTRPDGPQVKIMSQNEVEAMTAAKNQQQQQPNQQQQQQSQSQQQQPSIQQPVQQQNNQQTPTEQSIQSTPNASAENPDESVPQINGELKSETNGQLPNDNTTPVSNMQSIENDNIKNEQQLQPITGQQPLKPQTQVISQAQQPPQQQQAQPSQLQQPPPHQIMPQQNQPPPQMQAQFNAPPPFSYGMPPPGYMGYPPGPWPMHWQQQQPPQGIVETPAKSLISKPGVIEPQVILIIFN